MALVLVGLGGWAGIALSRYLWRARAIHVGSSGVNVYLTIFDLNYQAEAASKPTVFPVGGQYRSSTDYLKAMFTVRGIPDNEAWWANPGMRRNSEIPDDHVWNPEYTVWCVAVLPDEETARKRTGLANAPFLFTRNIGFGDPPGPFRPGMTTADMNGLLPDQRPLGRQSGVVITYGGAVRIIPGPQATPQALNPGGHALEILRP